MAGRQIVDVPYEHYKSLYSKSDAQEIAARTGLGFDNEKGQFEILFFGIKYYVTHPVFMICEATCPEKKGLNGPYEEILIMRFLLEGIYAPPSDRELSYEEIPSGAVYNTQFDGRVVRRIAGMFGKDISLLKTAMDGISGLNFEAVDGADTGYRFEFLRGYFISILVWAGDDEFPTAAQLLFSDNFKYAFTAEDLAVVGDIVASRLKRALKPT